MWEINDYIEGLVPEGAPILCPFHDDHIPSAYCTPGTKLFYCFTCRILGDQTECAKRVWFPDDSWGVGISLAAAYLRQNKIPIVSNQFNGDIVVPNPADDPRLVHVMTEWCHLCNDNLFNNKEILQEIITTRGIKDPIGYGLGLAGYNVFNQFNKEMGKQDKRWNDNELTSKCGITYQIDEKLVPYDKRYRLDDRLVIPEVRNGKVIYFQCRAQKRQHKLRYLNPKGLPRPVFGWDSLKRNTNFVWFVEGVFDMIPLLEANQSVICCNGLGFNDKILENLQDNLNGRSVAIVFDNDTPDSNGERRGEIEGLKRVEKFKSVGISSTHIEPPYKDVGEWVTIRGVQEVIASVTWRM